MSTSRDTSIRNTLLRDLVMQQPLFTSDEAAKVTEAAPNEVSKLLGFLARAGLVTKIMRGTWANVRHSLFSPYLLVGHLAESWGVPTYVSFVSALHLHGVLSQIPREIHVATDRLRPVLRTPVATYVFHQLQPSLLTGYEAGDAWGRFQRATAEKALFDTVYVSLRRAKRWRHLPELELGEDWDWDTWTPWTAAVASSAIRLGVERTRKMLQRRSEATDTSRARNVSSVIA